MIISTFLVLSTLIHAEPIPKSDPEGTILLVKSDPQPEELILLKSGGTILKRFEPKGLEGRINSVRLNPSATKAIVVCTKPNQLLARGRGARNWPHYNICNRSPHASFMTG